MAMRELVEKNAICNRLAVREKESGNREQARYYLKLVKEAEYDRAVIHEIWMRSITKRSDSATAGEDVRYK